MREWKRANTQKLWLSAGRGRKKKPIGTIFRTKHSGKAYRHTEHLLERLKGLSWKITSRRGKKIMLLLFVSYDWQERSLKSGLWRGLSSSDYFTASPCHCCVFWYMFLLLNSSTCSKVINASVSVFLRLTYTVQSLVKSVVDILCFSTPKSNEKLFYSQTYLLTAYFTERKFSEKLTKSEKALKLLLRFIFFPLGLFFNGHLFLRNFLSNMKNSSKQKRNAERKNILIWSSKGFSRQPVRHLFYFPLRRLFTSSEEMVCLLQ